MPFHVSAQIAPLLSEASRTLGVTHKGLAEVCKTSMRSAQRWTTARAHPSPEQVMLLARAVLPIDPDLAEALAQEAGTSLVAAGLVAPPAPTPAAATHGPPARPFPPVALMVDSILHAATQSAGAHAADPTSHQAIVEITRAAFARARGLGLSVEEVHGALVAAGSPPKK
jgi:hypothetical protein